MSGVTVMAVVVASCSSSSGSGWSGSAATTSGAHAPAPTTSAQPLRLLRPLKPLKQPGARRGAPRVSATLVRFNTADGISLDGAVVGTGTVRVVLAHEYDNDLCGACRFANYPAKRGLRVFGVDVRCLGRSACPPGDAADWVDDLFAAVAQLRQRGVTRVALVGASMGGSAALIAATRVKPPVDPVVELSGQAKPTSLLRIPLNFRGAIHQLTVPTMLVVADYDQYTSVDESRATYQTNKPAEERLLVLPGQFDGLHGWIVLTNACGPFSSTTTKVAEFIHPEAVSESIVVACGMMAHRRCGVGPRFERWRHRCRRRMGLGVCRPCLTWWWRSLFAVAVTGEMTYQVSADQPAIVEAAGKDAAQVGLIGDCAIAWFKEIAAGLISRVRSTECSRVVWTSSVRGVRGRSVQHAALRLRALGPVRRARRGRLGNPHGSGRPGRRGPSRAARACWDRS
jgi:predicted alpha/beta-hydrolase family hydrolase